MNDYMTIIQAWGEIVGLNNKINLFETLREVNGDIKSSKVKEILVQGGFINSNSMLNIIMKKDEYTDRLKALYDSKRAYEEYIEREIDRLKVTDIQLAVAFLKDYKKMKWQDIAKRLSYSKAQTRRFYDEYKEKYLSSKDEHF